MLKTAVLLNISLETITDAIFFQDSWINRKKAFISNRFLMTRLIITPYARLLMSDKLFRVDQ